MFKKCFSTVACMNLGYLTISEKCREYGIRGVEIRLGSDESVCGAADKKELENLKSTFLQAGVEIVNIGSSACFCGYDREAIDTAERAVKIASALRSKAIRVFCGNFSAKVNPCKPSIDKAGIVSGLAELCDFAAKYNIEIWLETHNEFSVGKSLTELISAVGRDNLKIIWDIIHPIEDRENIESTWDSLADKIAHIHIKDGINRRNSEWHDYLYTRLGEGELPIFSILDLLNDGGYDGYISFEWETEWRGELQKFPQNIDYVLEQYNNFLDDYYNNIAPPFDGGWSLFESRAQDDKPGIVKMSDRKSFLTLEVDNDVLARYECRVSISRDTDYYISVPFEYENVSNSVSAYAMITIFNDSGDIERRLYLNRAAQGKAELAFRNESGTGLRIELGLKENGCVRWYKPCLVKRERRYRSRMKIGAVHIEPVYGSGYEENLIRIEEIFDRAAAEAPDLLIFPETIGDRGTTLPKEKVFEGENGLFCTLMKRKAAEHRCYAAVTFHEEDENGLRHNTALLINRDGNIVGRYVKTHQALAEFEMGMTPGNSYPVFDTELGRIGMLICWDAYFAEPAKAMAAAGAEILLVSTAGNPTYRHMARAVENGVYVAVACAAHEGDSGILPTKIISPSGRVLGQTDSSGEAVFAEVDLDKKEEIFWLSVGASFTEPKSVYMNERRYDLWPDK